MSDSLPLTWDEYMQLDATGMAQMISRGDVSAKELAAQAAAAAALVNPRINAVIEVFDDVIADPGRDGMHRDGPFHGVPTMLKDMGSRMKGRAQENGYLWQRGNIAERDDPLTENWRAAGFNLMGRTTCPEDGITHITHSMKDGDTRNPWNLRHTPGGSSGGASAVVASGAIPVASASDGGGSIRYPAAWTGLVGLKPSRGLLPMPTGFHEALMPSAVEGVVTKTVRDAAAIYYHLSHKPLGSGFMAFPKPAAPYLEQLSCPPRNFRIGVSTGSWSRTAALDPVLKQKTLDTADLLASLGHQVENVQDADICDFEALFRGYLLANWLGPIGMGLQATAAAHGVELSESNTSRQALNHVEFARGLTLEDHLEAAAINPVITRQWGHFWERGYDLLLTPLTSVQCPGLDSLYRTDAELPFEQWMNNLVDSCRYAMPANETGLPAISLPAGLDDNGCPLAIQLIAPWAKEADLIHIASQLEQATPECFNQLAPFNVASVA